MTPRISFVVWVNECSFTVNLSYSQSFYQNVSFRYLRLCIVSSWSIPVNNHMPWHHKTCLKSNSRVLTSPRQFFPKATTFYFLSLYHLGILRSLCGYFPQTKFQLSASKGRPYSLFRLRRLRNGKFNLVNPYVYM